MIWNEFVYLFVIIVITALILGFVIKLFYKTPQAEITRVVSTAEIPDSIPDSIPYPASDPKLDSINNRLDDMIKSHKQPPLPPHHIDPVYKQLERALRLVYDYPQIYVREWEQSGWYVPYIGPETTSIEDEPWFLEFASKVIQDYPKSYLYKLTGRVSMTEFKPGEDPTHPMTLVIWRADIEDILQRSQAIGN